MVTRIFVKHLHFGQCKILLYVPRVCSWSHEKCLLAMSCPPIHPSVVLSDYSHVAAAPNWADLPEIW